MRIYLDDDSTSTVLIGLLRKGGHDVQIPADVGLSGRDDVVHLIHTVKENRILLSHNHDDFLNLDDLVHLTGGVHPGIFVIRRENHPRRDMSAADIARAIGNLVSANFAVENQVVILNHWR